MSAADGRSQRDERPANTQTSHEPSSSVDALVVPTWMLLLAANWRVLLAGMVLALAIAGIPQLTAPRLYVAESLIAPTVSWTQVQFEPKIKTVDSTSGQQNQASAITPERRQALVDLIRSSAIEQAVIRELAGKLPDTQLQPGGVVQQITGGLKPRSEILGIQAVAGSPDIAVMLAGAWARAYVEHVNRVYTPPDADQSIVQLREQAQAQVEKAQLALTSSIRESRLEALDREINEYEQTLRLLRTPYQMPASSTTASGAALPGAVSTTIDSPAGMTNDYRLIERRTLDDIAQTLRRLEATRESVRALVSQSGADTSGVASAAALSLVKAQLVSVSGSLPSQVQFQVPVSDNGATRAELEALVASIEQARVDVALEFERRRQIYERNRDDQVTQLEAKLRALRADREQADSERKQLTSQRDLAADTYSALARKAEETRVAQGTQGREVDLASEATYATATARISPTNLVVAALVGLAVASIIVLLVALVNPAGGKLIVGQNVRSGSFVARGRASDERRMREAIS